MLITKVARPQNVLVEHIRVIEDPLENHVVILGVTDEDELWLLLGTQPAVQLGPSNAPAAL